MPHRAAILEGMARFGYTGSRERMKDKLVLTAGFRIRFTAAG